MENHPIQNASIITTVQEARPSANAHATNLTAHTTKQTSAFKTGSFGEKGFVVETIVLDFLGVTALDFSPREPDITGSLIFPKLIE